MAIFKIFEPTRPPIYKILRLVQFLLVCCCCGLLIVLIYDDGLYKGYVVRTCFVAVGAYLIILAVDLITQLFGQPIPITPMLAFLIIGAALFITSGTLAAVTFDKMYYDDTISRAHYNTLVTCMIVFSILCFIIAILMVVDIIVSFLYDYKRNNLKNEEYRFDPVKANLASGDVILHLVNPQHLNWKNRIPKDSNVQQSENYHHQLVAMKRSNQQKHEVQSRPEEQTVIQQLLKTKDSSAKQKKVEPVKLKKEEPIKKDPKLTKAGELMNQPSEDMIVKDVRTSQLALTDSTEITSLKGKFYLVKTSKPPAALKGPPEDVVTLMKMSMHDLEESAGSKRNK